MQASMSVRTGLLRQLSGRLGLAIQCLMQKKTRHRTEDRQYWPDYELFQLLFLKCS